ncbi:binding partner of ACD11 1-like [Arachis stenosperma]|uniref:binding partner of ACD11 1-like n=1 Tax=Arachis stenosperma TaxID=217475 RepID=UPI0025AD4B95|nr:binding partner of ACD11 1-like [Arachis stenosperma]
MATRTVKVSNISSGATEQDLKEFLTYPGKIEHIEIKSENNSKVAYVTFNSSDGAETAVLLSGAVLVGQAITIVLATDYVAPASAASTIPTATGTTNADAVTSESGLLTAEDVVSSMLAKGYILGQDVLNRAKSFDERHQLTSTASSKVATLDQKVGITEKITAGSMLVNDKVKEMDERYQVSEKAKSAMSAAEQSLSTAGSTLMKNRYVLTGATWVTGAYSKVAKAAEEVGQKTMEKVLAQENQENSTEVNKDVHNSTTTTTTTTMPEPQHVANTAVQPPRNEPPQQATTASHPSNPSTTQGLNP